MTSHGGDAGELIDLMARLRAECPWKAAQTHESLAQYLTEEAAEAVEAMAHGDADHLREELGDVLLQVVFHSAIAAERGDFTFDDVVAGLIAKLRHRNPHVLEREPGAPPPTWEEAVSTWERQKAAEPKRQRRS